MGLSLATAVVVGACSSGGPASPAAPSPASPATSAAPSAAPGGGTAPTDADLAGRIFIVTGANGHALVAGSETTLTFDAGRIGVHAGCNQMSGGYAIKDGRLDIGPMISTEMACAEPLMAQDQWISAFLPGAAITLDGDTLTLAKDGVTLTATDKTVVRPDKPLEGTTWVVESLVSNQAVSSMPAGVTASLEFTGGKVAVDTGCNKGHGSAAIGETAITFGPIGTTRMACAGPAGEVEDQVLKVLAGDVAWTIDADVLWLRGAAGGLDLRAQPDPTVSSGPSDVPPAGPSDSLAGPTLGSCALRGPGGSA
jgi:heat shock protein HslJ